MNEEFKTKEIVSELVPHKGKMFLLNRVQSYSLETISITTEIDITRDDLFTKMTLAEFLHGSLLSIWHKVYLLCLESMAAPEAKSRRWGSL